MRWNLLNRKIHYWASLFVALPLLVIIGTGICLQLKKQWTWVQPSENRGGGIDPALHLQRLLTTVQQIEHLDVGGWDDIDRLDIRPAHRIAKVILHNGWEVQIDLKNASVLQTAYRRSDLLESLHDGSFFAGNWTKLS